MQIEIAPRTYAELLDRQLFVCLVRLSDGHYEILNDLNCVACFYARNDGEAVQAFRNFIAH
jgi:hypothetical protein